MPLQALVNCSSFALVLICFVLKSLGFSITSTFHDLNGAHQEPWRVPFLSGVALSATNSAIYLRPRPSSRLLAPSRCHCPLSQHSSAVLMLISCWLSAHVNRRQVELAVAGAERERWGKGYWGPHRLFGQQIWYCLFSSAKLVGSNSNSLANKNLAAGEQEWVGGWGMGGRGGMPYCFPSKYSSHAVTNSRLEGP